MTTGQRIKAARKRAGITQEDLGAKLGVSGSMIAQYETDKRNPKKETLTKIADALGIEPFALSNDLFNEAFLALLKKGYTDEEFQTKFLDDSISFAILTGENDRNLLRSYFMLNERGQEKALDYVEDLAEKAEYLKNRYTTPRLPQSSPLASKDTATIDEPRPQDISVSEQPLEPAPWEAPSEDPQKQRKLETQICPSCRSKSLSIMIIDGKKIAKCTRCGMTRRLY